MINDNISYLYMMYQAVVMGASMLAPATVVLMVAGAIHVVVGGGLYWLWLAMSMGAAVFYMFICFRYIDTTESPSLMIVQINIITGLIYS